MAYTKDPTQSQAYKDYQKSRETSSGSTLLDAAVELKSFAKNKYEEQLENNMKLLQDEKVYEKQKVKQQLNGLNDFYSIQKDIQENYDGDVRAWASKFEADRLRNEAYNVHGVEKVDSAGFTVSFPDEAYGGFLDTRTTNLVNRYNKIANNLDNISLPYRELNKAHEFVDSAYERGFETMSMDNKFNMVKAGRSLWDGQGLGVESPEELKKRFDNNIMNTGAFEGLNSIQADIKALYMYDPSLVDKQKQIIRNADVKKDFKNKISEPYTRKIQKRDSKGRLTGQTFEQRVYDITSSWIDSNNNFQQKTITEVVNNKNTTPGFDIAQHTTHLSYLRDKGHAQYNELVNSGDYSPNGAFVQLKEEFGKTSDEMKFEGNRNVLLANAQESWKVLFDSYFEESLSGSTAMGGTKIKTLRKDIEAYKNDEGPKPVDYYPDYNSYLQSLDKTAAIEARTYTKLNPRLVEGTPGSSIVLMREELSDSLEWKNFIGSEESIIAIKEDMLGIKGTLEEQYINDYKNNINDNVSREGNFFINYFSEEEKLTRGLILLPEANPDNPNAKTIKEVTGLDAEAFGNNPVEIGYNFRTNTPVFKAVAIATPEPTSETTENLTENLTEKTWLQKTNDVPYIGAVSNFMLGDKLNWVDATWLIPGYGVLKLGGKVTTKAAVKIATTKMLNNPTTMKTAEKFMKMRQSTKTVKVRDSKGKVIKIKDSKGNLVDKTTQQNTGQFLGFNNKKAMDNYIKNLSVSDQAILAGVSKSGKSFEPAKFVNAFTNLKGIELLGKASKVTSKLPSIPSIVKLGIPLGAAVMSDNINQGKTTEEEED